MVFRPKFLPAGQECTHTSTGQNDAGPEEHEGTGLDYMMARYYSPETAFRFLSVDPAASSVNQALPSTWNRYSYVFNSPLLLIDSDGEKTTVAIGGPTMENGFGHSAITINGTVYSQGTQYSGGNDWGVSAESYFTDTKAAGASQGDLRQTTLLEINLSPAQEASLEKQLQDNQPKEATSTLSAIGAQSCVAACTGPLRDAEVLEGPGNVTVDSAGNFLQAGAPTTFTPEGLQAVLEDNGSVISTSTRGTPPVDPATKLETIINKTKE